MESWPRRHRIDVHEYHRMAEVGLLAPDARVELIEGEIIDMAPIGGSHQSVVDYLTERFILALTGKAIVRTQGSVRLGLYSEPQPDLLVLKPRDDYYRSEFARGEDVLLAIEVSDSTLRYDRKVKMPLFARHGIPEAWIVDLQNGTLQVHRSPADGEYRDVSTLEQPGTLALSALPGFSIDLAALRLD
jgi:Uma2 family endonuclease